MAGQAAVQIEGVVSVLAWSAAATLALLFVTRKLTGLRAKDEEIEDGLDLSTHGERSFSL
jgi:Amt family ammonium transporter